MENNEDTNVPADAENSEEIEETIVEEEKNPNIIDRDIQIEMKESYLDYAMSVIVSRALPDVRDGLKPVHRRILYGMHSMGMHFNKPTKKSARIVGEVLGKYHPHGDSSVYDALVRMTQDFALRYPLIKGQGNFGSIDGDSAAAMRYTEAKLHKISNEMLQDIEKDTVEFVPNFDGSLKEPSVLPGKLPNLLLNGASGIAVGMATNIPPHNLQEVCDSIIEVIKNPEVELTELLEIIKGPDFPTGGIISGKRGIVEAFTKGRGKVKVQSKYHIEEKGGKTTIVIDEIPYQVNKALLIQQIANCVKDKVINGISDLRDESDKDGMRIVIMLKRDANSDIVVNQLYKHTRCRVTFGIIMLALVKKKPCILGLREIIDEYVKHREEVVVNRIKFNLMKAEKRAHILQGIKKALDDIDNVIKLIKESKSAVEAREGLISRLSIDEIQANAILEMQLQKLTGLEQNKILDELKELEKLIEELKSILQSRERIRSIIVDELTQIRDTYGDKRKTEIIEGTDDDLEIEDLIKPEEMVVTMSHVGYIKRVPLGEYKQQKRGGRGIKATTNKDEDFVENMFVANTHDYILFFTNKGKVHWLKVFRIPSGSRIAKGSAIVNMLELAKDEQVSAYVVVKKFEKEKNLIFGTKKGIVKKCSLINFSRPRRGGIIAINLDDNDDLINVALTDGKQDVMFATSNGNAVRFNEVNIRTIGRSGRGVKGITLKPGDFVVGMIIADERTTVLSVTEFGFGKRTLVSDYRLTARGGTGVINIKTSERNGHVVAIKSVVDDDELMLISQHGVLIRTRASGINVIGRNTLGVRLMRLGAQDKVTDVAKIAIEEDEIVPE